VTLADRRGRLLGTIHPVLTGAIAAAAVAAAVLSGPAVAQTYPYRVELANTAKKARAHAGNVDWECRGKLCVSAAPGGNVSVRGCRELASQVGQVVSYRSKIKHLEDKQIEACNAVLAEAGPTAAPQATGSAATAAPARVTTEELTFTGVHEWSPAK
jgi:hypothetical protein